MLKKKTKAQEELEREERAKKTPAMPELVRGMKDIMPQDAPYWEWLYARTGQIARDYGFDWVETPIVEPASLFIRAVGKQTDIVEKELYRFNDQGGEDLVLRPEATASVARAYANHGLWNQPQPVKLWYWGPMFRHDRPQAGRYRQFHQCGFETVGDDKPVVDAELIMLSWNLLRELGLNVEIQVNSLGSMGTREAYREKLLIFYRANRSSLCEDCKTRMQKNPLRLLDCKKADCLNLRTDAPQLIDALDEGSKDHFMKVLEYLDEVEVPYVLNPYLVRGLDYYNRTVFEIVVPGEEDRAQNALGGGGRYDDLMELLGSRPTPAAGLALGLERIILALKAANIEPVVLERPKVFMAQLGEQAKRRALRLFEECRRSGLQISQAFVKDSLKAQLELANKLGVQFTVILGQKEVLDETAVVRDMESGVQEIVDQKKLIHELRKKLIVKSQTDVANTEVPEPEPPSAPEGATEGKPASAKAAAGKPEPASPDPSSEVLTEEEASEEAKGGEPTIPPVDSKTSS